MERAYQILYQQGCRRVIKVLSLHEGVFLFFFNWDGQGLDEIMMAFLMMDGWMWGVMGLVNSSFVVSRLLPVACFFCLGVRGDYLP